MRNIPFIDSEWALIRDAVAFYAKSLAETSTDDSYDTILPSGEMLGDEIVFALNIVDRVEKTLGIE